MVVLWRMSVAWVRLVLSRLLQVKLYLVRSENFYVVLEYEGVQEVL